MEAGESLALRTTGNGGSLKSMTPALGHAAHVHGPEAAIILATPVANPDANRVPKRVPESRDRTRTNQTKP